MRHLFEFVGVALLLIVAIPLLLCAWMGYKEKP